MTQNKLDKPIIHEVIRQELQDQLITERVHINQMKALFRDILNYDHGRAYIYQLPEELTERIVKCLKEF